MRSIAAGLIVFLLGTHAAYAQFKDEQLLQPLPPGYKLGFQTSKNQMNMSEYVPQNETVQNWTQMITVQIFLGMGKQDITPKQFLQKFSNLWVSACKGAKAIAGPDTVANNYPSSSMFLHCPLNAQTGKPENTLVRAIKGNDSMYVVQKAAKATLSEKQAGEAYGYLMSVGVCDTRKSQHPCPQLQQPVPDIAAPLSIKPPAKPGAPSL